MLSNDFRISLHGTKGSEIVDYATRMVECDQCQAGSGSPCTDPGPNRDICRDRFVKAIKHLTEAGERAIREEHDRSRPDDPAPGPECKHPGSYQYNGSRFCTECDVWLSAAKPEPATVRDDPWA